MVPAVAEDFDLYDLVYGALEASSHPDPKSVIPEVVKAIPDDQLRPTIERLLVEFVLAVNRRMRKASVAEEENAGDRRTSKRDRIAALAENIRQRREVLGDGDWKHLRHLAIGDVQLVISAYSRRAAANELEAKRYTRLLNAMKTAKVAQAGDLPDELLIELFQ